MKLKIWHKLALALLATTSLIVALTLFLSQQSFTKGFLSYLNSLEQRQWQYLAEDLKHDWSKQGNWDFLQNDQAQWQAYLKRHTRHGHSLADYKDKPHHDPDHSHSDEAPENNHYKHLAILDADKKRVVGKQHKFDVEYDHPLWVENDIIGYLHIEPFSKLTYALDQKFAKKQNKAFIWIALFALFVSLLSASLLAYFWQKRINALTRIARALTAGNFKDRIHAKPAYRFAYDELDQLGHDFNKLAQTLDKNRNSRQQWVADISHELRTPLSILNGEIEALEDGIRPLTLDAVKSLASEIKRLQKLVDDLYQLSLSDIGALHYTQMDVYPLQLLQDHVEHFQARFENAQLQVDWACQEKAEQPVTADEQRLSQLFTNLLENSARYTNPGGVIRLRCEDDKEYLNLIIEDSAPGVPEDKLPYLFDRMYRLERSRNRKTGGAGLGMAIVKEIVDAHNGDIKAQHSDLGGLSIVIRLPKMHG